MNVFLRRILILGAAMLAVGEVHAVSDTNRELAKTYVNFYIQEGEYEAAQKYLSDHLRTDNRDAGGWNLLGLSFIRTKAFPKAVQSFYRAVTYCDAKDPDRPIFLYHYADALVRTGDVEKAENVLKQIKNEELVASRVEVALASLHPREPLPELAFASNVKFEGTLSISAGYDGNVLLTSDGSLATLEQSETASPFAIPAAQVSWEFPSFGGTGSVTGLGAFTYQFNENAQRFNSLYSSLELSWAPISEPENRLNWRIYEDSDIIFLSEDGFGLFNFTESVGWKATWRHSAANQTEFTAPVRYLYYPLSEDENEINDRSGLSLRPALVHRRQIGKGILEAGVTYDHHFAAGDNFVADTFSFPLSWQQGLFSGLSGRFSFEAGIVSYPDHEDDRSDMVFDIGLQVAKTLSESVYGTVEIDFRRNLSTVNAARYSKFAGSLVMGYRL